MDASVKIYSNRVDDTHATSQKFIENLSRSLEVNDSGGPGQERGVARVGTKSAASRTKNETIAVNVDSINAVNIDRMRATDPMFSKMTEAFDEGGARGMLMTNLVSQSTHQIILIHYPSQSFFYHIRFHYFYCVVSPIFPLNA